MIFSFSSFSLIIFANQEKKSTNTVYPLLLGDKHILLLGSELLFQLDQLAVLGGLILAFPEGVDIEQRAHRLDVSRLAVRDGAVDQVVKIAVGELLVKRRLLIGKLLVQLGDPAVQLLHIHALKAFELRGRGFELRFVGVTLRFQLAFYLADVGAVDVENCRDLLVGRSLKNFCDVLSFHFCFLTFSLLSRSLSAPLYSFASFRTVLGIKNALYLLQYSALIIEFWAEENRSHDGSGYHSVISISFATSLSVFPLINGVFITESIS